MAAAVVFLVAPLAHAAGPGDTLLVSRPAGSGPLAPGLFDWNSSGTINEQGGEATQNVTPDGRYVVFVSLADGLAPGEDPGFAHVLRKDLETGALTVVDAGGNGDSTDPDISADGRQPCGRRHRARRGRLRQGHPDRNGHAALADRCRLGLHLLPEAGHLEQRDDGRLQHGIVDRRGRCQRQGGRLRASNRRRHAGAGLG
jgi:hypothetical protein